jgi:hypothetical protein
MGVGKLLRKEAHCHFSRGGSPLWRNKRNCIEYRYVVVEPTICVDISSSSLLYLEVSLDGIVFEWRRSCLLECLRL